MNYKEAYRNALTKDDAYEKALQAQFGRGVNRFEIDKKEFNTDTSRAYAAKLEADVLRRNTAGMSDVIKSEFDIEQSNIFAPITGFEVKADDLSSLIKKQYCLSEFGVRDDLEVGDCKIAIPVSPRELVESERIEIDKFRYTGDGHQNLQKLLIDMCNRKVIKSGMYVIDCSF